jgi:hypothetical protein
MGCASLLLDSTCFAIPNSSQSAASLVRGENGGHCIPFLLDTFGLPAGGVTHSAPSSRPSSPRSGAAATNRAGGRCELSATLVLSATSTPGAATSLPAGLPAAQPPPGAAPAAPKASSAAHSRREAPSGPERSAGCHSLLEHAATHVGGHEYASVESWTARVGRGFSVRTTAAVTWKGPSGGERGSDGARGRGAKRARVRGCEGASGRGGEGRGV